jgi:hypothetical protein
VPGVTTRRDHWVIRAVAGLLPRARALEWAEEMQSQLSELTGAGRRGMLLDVVCSAPTLWLTAWTLHRQQIRVVREHGDTLLLVSQLRTALDPNCRRARQLSVDVPDRFYVMRSLGLSRTLRRRTRAVPALRLAQRLLDTRSETLRPARTAARQLLQTREQAHLIARELRRTTSCGDDGLHRQLHLLRTLGVEQASDLRAALERFIRVDVPLPVPAATTTFPLA